MAGPFRVEWTHDTGSHATVIRAPWRLAGIPYSWDMSAFFQQAARTNRDSSIRMPAVTTQARRYRVQFFLEIFMLVRSMKTPFAVVAVVALLAACGGGGGGGGGSSSTSTPTVATTFNLERAYHAEIQALGTGSFAISGDCTGTGTVTKSRANFATFEGTFAVGVDITTNLTFTNCVPSNRSTTVTEWYRTGNLMAFGSSIAGGDYGVFLAEPSALPSAATIGSSGVFGTQTIYTDSTKTTIKALDDYSWAVEADGGSTTTAIAVLTVRRYSPGRATLLSTQTTRHRIMSSGVYSPISTELVQTSPTSLRLTYTPL